MQKKTESTFTATLKIQTNLKYCPLHYVLTFLDELGVGVATTGLLTLVDTPGVIRILLTAAGISPEPTDGGPPSNESSIIISMSASLVRVGEAS